MSAVLGLPGLALHEIPEAFVPEEPRLGGAAVPVPAARLAALSSTGTVLLGRRPDDIHLREFRASVIAETRSLFQVPHDHTLTVVAARPTRLCHLTAIQPWAAGLEVTGTGPRATAWRSAAADAREATVAPGRRTPLAVVADEDPGWRERLEAAPAGGWRVAELTGTAEVLTGRGVRDADVAFLCPSGLLGVGVGLTVAVLSPRAASASPGLTRALDVAGAAVGTGDLVMFAHAVRAVAESDAARAAAGREARRALVADWAAGRDWVTAPTAGAGDALTVRLVTALPPGVVTELGRFLETAHLAYGLTDPGDPHALRVGLYDSLRTADIERLLGLLDFLVARLTQATDPDQEGR
ncbi:hypothetical protein ACFWWC_13960 [Streptomyces sp. NPDC058642]|uniref:hypothetical protein n=1 Tax=Streptomyces sp. NPDC058642 TaxID=3346572 RepID=UPI003645F977